MFIRRLARSLRVRADTPKSSACLRKGVSLQDVIGKSVHISLKHLHYDGRLAAQYELYGSVTRVDDSSIIVRLLDSQQECRLRRDSRIFEESKDADFHVSVGSVGVFYLNDLTQCLYPYATTPRRRAALCSSSLIFVAFLLLYTGCLFYLLPKLSLCLDEIIDLKAVRDYNLTTLINYIARNAGVPLGYLAQAATIHFFGYSRFSGRLSSAVFALIACLGIFVLARRLQLRFPLLAVSIFCLLPLQLRYALEARPYSQALALTVWATICFFNLVDKATLASALIYGLLVIACLYTQPYTLFVVLVHFCSACFLPSDRAKRNVVALTTLAILIASLGFAPWYVYAFHSWRNASAPYANTERGIVLRAIQMILREITGAGYPATTLIICAAYLGLRHDRFTHEARWFWGLYVALPVAMTILADGVFGYFLPIRQMLWVLAPLAILAAAGVERIAQYRRGLAIIVCCLGFAILFSGDVRLFSSHVRIGQPLR